MKFSTLFTKKEKKPVKPAEFELEAADERVIQMMTDDIVEDAGYLLQTQNGTQGGTIGVVSQNPYYNKDARDMLKYELNAALRAMSRNLKLHLSRGIKQGQRQHPLFPYLKTYLLDAVRTEMNI